MVPCPWFEGALHLGRTHALAAGIHLTITGEWSNYHWQPLTDASSITTESGYMYPDYESLAAVADADDIYREYKAQIAFLKKRGWKITHIDSHMLMPYLLDDSPHTAGVRDIIETVAKEEGLPYLYGCNGDRFRYFESFSIMSGMNYQEVLAYLDTLGDGIHYLGSHCGTDSAEQRNIARPEDENYPWARNYRVSDLAITTSMQFRHDLQERGITLLSMDRFLGMI
jgi:hypothetical protein